MSARNEVALVDASISLVRRPEGFEQYIESLVHPPAEPGEPICNHQVETMERFYNSRTGWTTELREWNCTRGIHKAGPHIAHADDKAVLKWYEDREEPDRNGLEVVR